MGIFKREKSNKENVQSKSENAADKPLDSNATDNPPASNATDKPSDSLLGQVEADAVGSVFPSALYYPHTREGRVYVIENAQETHLDPNECPLPPYPLRLGYGYDAKQGKWFDERFLKSGETVTNRMNAALSADGFSVPAGGRVLEIGCAAGRLTRWWLPRAQDVEVWGVDLRADAITWCQQYLAPMNFITNTTHPHLPFEDNHFDLVYAGSVWTHIGDLADSWYLETRRILKPGGRAFITIFDDHSMETCMTKGEGDVVSEIQKIDDSHGILSKNYGMVVEGTSLQRTRVIHRTEYIRRKLEAWFEVREIVPEAYGWQSALILRKR
ncbi:class I SAM-dependent methyltransferase [Ruegeria lacuscaerulensis]|uniref:class I SAM-dependent methyltransferase n=1 Tax=Ruegeria lacuscaerulensis TaxID=55218 RepID=UPI00147B2BAF|nr:class I SAM-dependent methyltransferase [Ruegeria lacuscaerulensis]